jgi:hypothetical protein
MTGAQLFALVSVVIALSVFIVFAIIQAGKNRFRIKTVILDRLIISLKAYQSKPHESEQPVTESRPKVLTAEAKSTAELERIQKIIQVRKHLAMNTDISHHLWSLYKNHFRFTSPQSLDPFNQDGEWYGVKILQTSTKNNLNKFEFELKGAKYKFIDDEENRNWSDSLKLCSLFLYDESDHCLIEIPMKVKVDKLERQYSVLSGGPKAFLPGGWTNDFINATLIHQSARNKEIRELKHQERLWEIEDLKGRFGISD